MKLALQSQDVERLVVDYLTDLLGDVTVAVGVPTDWTPASTPHLEVASDGIPTQQWPIVDFATIRLVARAASTTAAKALCARAHGRLCACPGTNEIYGTTSLTGVLPARDPDTHAELASATVRVAVRTIPLD